MTDNIFDLFEHPGWVGIFTTQQAKGAMPNGTTVVKVREEKGDATPLGMTGTVLGSIWEPKISPMTMYFVEWADKAKVAVAVVDWKIRKR